MAMQGGATFTPRFSALAMPSRRRQAYRKMTEETMARRGDGIYQRGKTSWLDLTHEEKRHCRQLELGH
ncbi:MAG: hypothetical protein DMD87_30585 [Candidatus Rokuibacteriota bacterium]|nr:MAG: hypothetical protein DMD87_30585 [Candidatus Rokubacteria bacterium]